MAQESESSEKTVTCSPKELRELQRYVRKLEKELHEKNARLQHVRSARSLQLARALGALRKNPRQAAADLWRVVRAAPRARDAASASVRHRTFGLFNRAAGTKTAATPVYGSVLPEIVGHCAPPTWVTLRGCGPTVVGTSLGSLQDIGPYDYELVLEVIHRPWLLIDTNQMQSTSPWAAVFGIDDMRLNFAMATVVEIVRSRGGQVVFARVDAASAPPLLRDFQQDALLVDDFASFSFEGHPQE